MYPSSENKMMFAGEPPHFGIYALAQRKCWISSESVERHIHTKNTSRKGVHTNHICIMRTRWSLQESLLSLEYTRWHDENVRSPHSWSKDTNVKMSTSKSQTTRYGVVYRARVLVHHKQKARVHNIPSNSNQPYPSSQNKMKFAGEPPAWGRDALAQRTSWISS